MNDFFTKLFKIFEPAQAKLEPAIKAGLVNKVRKLLAKGVDPDKPGVSGFTPLYLACSNSDLNVVKLLLAANADVNVRCGSDGKSALCETCGDVYYINLEKWSRELNAREKIIKLLLAAGADVNAPDKGGRSPLYYAVRFNHTRPIELLLAAGADVNAPDKDGWSPLYCAASKSDDEYVKLLLAAGADVNAPDKYGSTPLHAASEEGTTKVISRLLAAGADVNAMNEAGYTPLHSASKKGRVGSVELLLAAGADVRTANKTGETPIDLAFQEGHRDVVRLLDAQADVSRIFTFDEWLAARGPFYDHGRPIARVDYLLALGEAGRSNLMAKYEQERQRFMATPLKKNS